MRHYLLTGASGVVGSAVLKLLAARGEKATLLIRADSDGHLRRRFQDLLSFCEISGGETNKFTALRADLLAPDFNLGNLVYDKLSRECTHVLHCAGNVNMRLPRHVAEEQTLSMTNNMLALTTGSSGVRKKMEFVSTVGVAGCTEGIIREEWIEHERRFHNSYEAAKARAETLVRGQIEDGARVTVHRPSMVVGDSRSGKNISFQVFYFLCEFITGMRTFGVTPRAPGMRLDVIPSDYVAEVIYWSSRREDHPPRILHACSGPEHSIDLDLLAGKAAEIFRQNGLAPPKRRVIPPALFKGLLRMAKPFASARTRRSLDTLPLFLSYLDERQYFANHKTRKLLEDSGPPLPEIDAFLPPVLKYYIKTRYRL